METLTRLIIYFAVYSLLGWFVESGYRSLKNRRLISSGFLYGPFIPVFGFGGLIIHLLYLPLQPLSYAVSLLILTTLVTALEYLAGWLMESLFGMRLWDYSEYKGNLHGRIAPRYSLYWLFLTLIVVHTVKPLLNELYAGLDPVWGRVLALVLVGYFFVDIGLSSHALSKFAQRVAELRGKAELELERFGELSTDFFQRSHSFFHDPLHKIIATRPEHILSSFSDRLEIRDLVQFVIDRVPQPINTLSETQPHTDSHIDEDVSQPESETSALRDLRRTLEPQERALIEKTLTQICDTPEYRQLEKLPFGNTNVLVHNERVARASYRLAKALSLDSMAAFRGALLRFPGASADVDVRRDWDTFTARYLVGCWENWGPFSETEKDIVLHSTFPIFQRPPRTPEGILVSILALAIGIREKARSRYIEPHLLSNDESLSDS